MSNMDTFVKTTPKWSNEEFFGFENAFKLMAILSDGQWYDAGKLKNLAKIRKSDVVRPILDRMVDEGRIIAAPNDVGISYRMSLEQLESWRSEHGIGVEEQLVAGILYPRIFGSGSARKTEAEMFLSAPRHKIGFCTFTLAMNSTITELEKSVGYLGKFRQEEFRRNDTGQASWAGDTYKIYCLSSDCIREKLRAYESIHGGAGAVFTKIGSFNMAMRRELGQFDDTAVAEMIEFYVKFGVVLVPYLKKTFQALLTDSSDKQGSYHDIGEEKDSILKSWVITVIQRYDETSCIPFSVYVQQLLPRLAASYANNVVGNNVNKFQTEKNKAIKRIRKNDDASLETDIYSAAMIHDSMTEHGYDITMDEYKMLDSQLSTWRSARKPTALQWDETNEDKKLTPSVEFVTESDGVDHGRTHRLQSAIIASALETEDYESAILMIRLLSERKTLAAALMSNISDSIGADFKDELARQLAIA